MDFSGVLMVCKMDGIPLNKGTVNINIRLSGIVLVIKSYNMIYLFAHPTHDMYISSMAAF
jgi:hypothetical protein